MAQISRKVYESLFKLIVASKSKYASTFLITILMIVAAPQSKSPAVEIMQTQTSVIETHFYSLQKEILAFPQGSTFVTLTGETEVILMLGINDADNWKTANNAVYHLSTFDVKTRNLEIKKDLDLRQVAMSGSRILDFEYLAGTNFGYNAVITIARNHGGGEYLCRDMVVLALNIPNESNTAPSIVKELYSTGCIPSNTTSEKILWNVLYQSGGQIMLAPEESWQNRNEPEFILTVGDFQTISGYKSLLLQDGLKFGENLASIIRIKDPGVQTKPFVPDNLLQKTGNITGICATGVRNAQGLAFIVSRGNDFISATSHGPRGGDYLMFFNCKTKKNFGWPAYSFGTSYGGKLKDKANLISYEGTMKLASMPAWTWTPSIGPSTLVQVTKKGAFSQWWGDSSNSTMDLIVSAMASKELVRMRLSSNNILGTESIPIGERCRSLVQLYSGTLVCGLDSNHLLVLSAEKYWDSIKGAFIESTS